jgi:type I restriction enzyme S subunit
MNLPNGWASIRLGDIGYLYCGQSVSATEVNAEGKGISYITGPEQWDGTRLHLNKWTESPKRIVPTGCIFITVKGAGVGKTFPGIHCAIGRDVYAFKPEIELNSDFVHNAIKHQISTIIREARGDIPGLSTEHITENVQVLPPLAEQRRIVAKLDVLAARVARARAELDRMAKLASRLRATTLSNAFHTSSVEGKIQHPLIDERVRSLHQLPSGWEWKAVAELGDVSGGLTKNPKRTAIERKIKYLRVANVYSNELRLVDVAEIGCNVAELEKTRLQVGDILIVEGNGSLKEVGRAAIWNAELPDCSHQNHLIRVRLGAQVHPKFMLFWLMSPAGRQKIERLAASTSGLQTLSISKISGLPVPFVPIHEQMRTVRKIEATFTRADRLEAEAARARKLLDRLESAILAKAFRGELVPQDPNDEPASVLLKRIRAERAAAPKQKRGGKAASA